MKGTVLVVDDEEGILRLLTEVLEAEFKVVTARSGHEALSMVDRELPDLIIMDIALPGMDGIETLKRIRARGGTAEVVILTAYPTALQVNEARDLGVSDVLRKPFYVDQLTRLVREKVGKER